MVTLFFLLKNIFNIDNRKLLNLHNKKRLKKIKLQVKKQTFSTTFEKQEQILLNVLII